MFNDLSASECLQVNQKREEIVDQIQDISRETQHIKATIQGLRDACNLDTDKAQVRLLLTVSSTLPWWGTLHVAGFFLLKLESR